MERFAPDKRLPSLHLLGEIPLIPNEQVVPGKLSLQICAFQAASGGCQGKFKHKGSWAVSTSKQLIQV